MKNLIVLIILTLIFFQCDKGNKYNFKQEGKASYYHKSLHGNPTKTGEKFDTAAKTAAHPFLPMNTKIEVTNMTNQKSIKLRVNDRGPYADNRILDVTPYAAGKLDFKDEGIAKIKIEARLNKKTLDSLKKKYKF